MIGINRSNSFYESLCVTVIIPFTSGADALLDTLDSVAHYCRTPCNIIMVDDHTEDGTYESINIVRHPEWHILRNKVRLGTYRLVHTLSLAYNYFLDYVTDNLVLRLDQDALIIGHGVIEEAFDFMRGNPSVGIFGVYSNDYDRPRSLVAHEKLIKRETGYLRRLACREPSWCNIYNAAIKRGYRSGDNVFGGAYFITRDCLDGIKSLGGLHVPYDWYSRMQEDVYFSMASVAAGFDMGHFAAPSGPLCLEWRGLPYPAAELFARRYKIVHSVDKGKNTGPEDNDGLTAREFFRKVRQSDLQI